MPNPSDKTMTSNGMVANTMTSNGMVANTIKIPISVAPKPVEPQARDWPPSKPVSIDYNDTDQWRDSIHQETRMRERNG